MQVNENNEAIASTPKPTCYLCGSKGTALYQGLRDRFVGVPGEWNLRCCPSAWCGLVWMDPMPTEEDIGKAYRTYYTHGLNDSTPSANWLQQTDRLLARAYLSRRYGYSEPTPSTLDLALSYLATLYPGRKEEYAKEALYLPASMRGRLLDIGCGDGAAVARMRTLGWDAEGIEVDPAAAEIAQRNNLPVGLGTIQQQQYPDNWFNAITMNHVIEHVHDPVQLLRECRRVLAPGGGLVVMTPNVGSWGHRRFKADWFPLDPPRHLWLFSRRTMRVIAARAGFERLTLTTTIHHAHRQFIASMLLRRNGHILHRPTLRLQLWGQWMELREWLRLQANRDSGEEMLVLARK